MTTDWAKMSEQFGGVFGADAARIALTQIVGPAEIERAVQLYVHGCDGSELILSVLRMLKPLAARDECLKIFRSERDPECRASAVELFRFLADQSALQVVPQFLQDPDPVIQLWGASVVDYVVLDAQCREPDVLLPYVQLLQSHPNASVAEIGERVASMVSLAPT